MLILGKEVQYPLKVIEYLFSKYVNFVCSVYDPALQNEWKVAPQQNTNFDIMPFLAILGFEF